MSEYLTRRRLLQSMAAASVAGVVTGGGAAAPTQQQNGWPQPRYDGANTCHNPRATPPRAEPTVETLVSPSETLGRSLIVAGGRIFTVLGERTTVAYASDDGTEAWRWSNSALPGGSGTPLLGTANNLFVVSENGNVLSAVDPAAGERKWLVQPSEPRLARASNGTLYYPIVQNLVSVDENGEQQWDELTPFDVSGLGVTADRIYGTTPEHVVALNTADGARQWTKELSSPGNVPVISDGQVYVRTDTITALDAGDGTIRWEADDLPSRPTTPVAVTPEMLYVGADSDSTQATFFALNTETGAIEWRAELGSPTTPSSSPATVRPAVTSDTVYVTSVDSTVHALDPSTGDILWRETFDVEVGPPVPAENTLYIGTEANEILAFRTQSTQDDDPSDPDGDGDDDTPDETHEETDDSEGSDSGDGFGPGFGVPAALTALGGAGYLLGRRRGEE